MPSTAKTLFIEGNTKFDLFIKDAVVNPLKLKHLTIMNFDYVYIPADLSQVNCVHLLLNANTKVSQEYFAHLNLLTDPDIYPGLLGDNVDIKGAYMAFFYKRCELENNIKSMESLTKELECKRKKNL